MGSAEGARKAAATRIGVTFQEYQRRVNLGQRWCCQCKAWRRVTSFNRDASRTDGLARTCRGCQREQSRSRYEPRPRKRGRRYVQARDGDRLQARGRVNHLVNMGLLEVPSGLACVDCSEQASEYDHHLGYAAEHHEDVEPVCPTCHARRTRERGELEQHRGSDGRFCGQNDD